MLLTAPPAIIPVPSKAGFKYTLVAPNLPIISCGRVWEPTSETVNKFFLAFSTAFLIASGTSAAFPIANPNLPFLSPTTTRAENLKVLPPFLF